MSGMTLGDILDILAERHGDVKLKDATYTARCILELSRNVTESVAQESYNKGYADGVAAKVPSLTEQKQTVRRNVADVVRNTGSHKKITVIKKLRELSGLGLRETKEIVDEYISGLDRFASWERELIDPLYVPRAN